MTQWLDGPVATGAGAPIASGIVGAGAPSEVGVVTRLRRTAVGGILVRPSGQGC
jgi:hypothetical protein